VFFNFWDEIMAFLRGNIERKREREREEKEGGRKVERGKKQNS